MTDSDDLRLKWDERHRHVGPVTPARVLADNAHLLPARGRALDLACGLGGNARFLAARGFAVTAWDLSEVAMARLDAEAREAGLTIRAEARDVVARPPGPGEFDIIVVGHFLERGLAGPLVQALRPGGLLFYQTFVRETVGDAGPRNPDYRLDRNELLTLFSGLLVRFYREEGRLGDTARGFRDLAQLVAQRPG